jgi:hypothetical protein
MSLDETAPSVPFGGPSEVSSNPPKEKEMRKLHVLTAASALAFATPVMAQGIFRVPPGQMPPTGMCRIWIDGVPPGRQPAPMNCDVAARRLPANAHLIYGQRVYGNNGYYNNDRIYQDEIRRQRELEIARERQLQIEREREFQMARQRELLRDQQIRAREAEEARFRAQANRERENRDRGNGQDRDHRWNGSQDHRNDSNDQRDIRRGHGGR